MIDTLALLKEASYGFLGGPLARGNFREPKSSGHLPFVVHPDAVQTGFLMQNMQTPHGWDPKEGAVKTDGVDGIVINANNLNVDPSEFTLFLDNVWSESGNGAANIAMNLAYNLDNEAFIAIDFDGDSYFLAVQGEKNRKLCKPKHCSCYEPATQQVNRCVVMDK